MQAAKPSAINALSICMLATVFSCVSHAQTVPPRSAPKIWFNAGSYSHHFDSDKDYREHNNGFGIEFWITEDHALMGGTFINSEDARSNYVAYQWRPLNWQLDETRIGVGITLGAFNGYPRYDNGAWFPAALPVLSAEYKRIGVNLFFVPTIPGRVDGALAIQLKVGIW